MPQYASAPYGRYPSVGEVPQQEYVDVAGSAGNEIQKASMLFKNMVDERVKAQQAQRKYEAEMELKQKADERADAESVRQETRQDKELERWDKQDTQKQDEVDRVAMVQGRMDAFKEDMKNARKDKGRRPTLPEAKDFGIMNDVQDTEEFQRFMKTYYPLNYQKPSSGKASTPKIPDSGLGTEAENLYYEYMRNPAMGDQIGREAFSKIAEAERENERLTELLGKYEDLKIRLDEADLEDEKAIIQKQLGVFEAQMDFPTTAETIEFNTQRINDLKELENMIQRNVGTGGTYQRSSSGGTGRKIPKSTKRTGMNARDRRALKWAKDNPTNPTAKKILDRLKQRFPNEF